MKLAILYQRETKAGNTKSTQKTKALRRSVSSSKCKLWQLTGDTQTRVLRKLESKTEVYVDGLFPELLTCRWCEVANLDIDKPRREGNSGNAYGRCDNRLNSAYMFNMVSYEDEGGMALKMFKWYAWFGRKVFWNIITVTVMIVSYNYLNM